MLLMCSGCSVGMIEFPPFEVRASEFVGIAVPAIFDLRWLDVLLVLSGWRVQQGIDIAERGTIVFPQRVLPSGWQPEMAVHEFYGWDNMARAEAEAFSRRYSIDPNVRIGTLGLSQRMLLGLQFQWVPAGGLVVLSTAGLDPIGIDLVYDLITLNLQRGSAIDVFSASLTSVYSASAPRVQRFIQCRRRDNCGL